MYIFVLLSHVLVVDSLSYHSDANPQLDTNKIHFPQTLFHICTQIIDK
jgi:hypothetical protein